jgi:hypothetical protein
MRIGGVVMDRQQIIEDLKQHGYEIPKWCNAPLINHNDGMGGCWGISSGYLRDSGNEWCESCEYFKKRYSGGLTNGSNKYL